jgi:hypothetical protein
VIQRPCWDKAICIPGERSLERSRFESTVSSRNLFKDRIINCVLVEQFDEVMMKLFSSKKVICEKIIGYHVIELNLLLT